MPGKQRLIRYTYDTSATARLAAGLDILGSGRVVVTDRLHALLLSTLSRIPCIAVDNIYGKISTFYQQWLADVPGCSVAASPEEARQMAHKYIHARVD